MKEICERIKKIRNEYFLTQVAFAKKIGVTNAHISKIEKGGTVPSEALIKLICKEYKVNEAWLKEGVEPIFSDDLETEIDTKMIIATESIGKLLLSPSINVRHIVAELELKFSSTIEIDVVVENKAIEYLNLVLEMFNTINQNNIFIKDNFKAEQYVMKNILKTQIQQYKAEMNKCIDDFAKSLNEYE